MEGWLQAVVTAGVFVVAAVGGLIIWEIRKVHDRITKYAKELDEHVKESIEVHKSLERIETKQDLHMENGHRHKE